MTLEEINESVAERFRVSAQEIAKIERLPKQHRRAALYRKIILNISKDPAYKLRPRTREVAKMIGIPYFRACSYIATSGAWSGQPWIVGGSKEEKAFERDMTRPAKYFDEIKNIMESGFEPPCLPPDYYDRYIQMRALKKRGLSLMDARTMKVARMINDNPYRGKSDAYELETYSLYDNYEVE